MEQLSPQVAPIPLNLLRLNVGHPKRNFSYKARHRLSTLLQLRSFVKVWVALTVSSHKNGSSSFCVPIMHFLCHCQVSEQLPNGHHHPGF